MTALSERPLICTSAAEYDNCFLLDVIIAIIATFFAKAIITISQLSLSILHNNCDYRNDCYYCWYKIDRDNSWVLKKRVPLNISRERRGRFACLTVFQRVVEGTEGRRGYLFQNCCYTFYFKFLIITVSDTRSRGQPACHEDQEKWRCE
jgi:hypothetical protein